MLPMIGSAMHIYNYINTPITNKNLILEPFCTLVKLILLSYKPSGTKISIYNNSIQFHEPSIIQGFLRIWTGDCREDLHNLYNPIIKMLEYSDRSNEIHINLLRKCIDGLNIILKVYDSNTIINHTLLHYINIIEKYIDINVLDNSLKGKNSPLIDGLKIFWNEKEIDLIYDMLEHINDKNDLEKKVYLKNIEDIITFKEKEVNDYIHKKSTTYD
tara:strand:- start:758 stop:1402 length:645 start_codon:yes stop_codon:yes gene_type:complete